MIEKLKTFWQVQRYNINTDSWTFVHYKKRGCSPMKFEHPALAFDEARKLNKAGERVRVIKTEVITKYTQVGEVMY